MNKQLTSQEAIEVLASTKLSDEQEKLLAKFCGTDDEMLKAARLAYYFRNDESNNSMKNYQPKKSETLTEEGSKNQLLNAEKEYVTKFGLDENAVRNTQSQLTAKPKPVEVLARAAQKGDSKLRWDNVKQDYVLKEDKPKQSNLIEV